MSEMEHLKLSEASLPLLHTDLKHHTNWKHPEKYLQVTDVIKTSPPNRNAKFPQSYISIHLNYIRICFEASMTLTVVFFPHKSKLCVIL